MGQPIRDLVDNSPVYIRPLTAHRPHHTEAKRHARVDAAQGAVAPIYVLIGIPTGAQHIAFARLKSKEHRRTRFPAKTTKNQGVWNRAKTRSSELIESLKNTGVTFFKDLKAETVVLRITQLNVPTHQRDTLTRLDGNQHTGTASIIITHRTTHHLFNVGISTARAEHQATCNKGWQEEHMT